MKGPPREAIVVTGVLGILLLSWLGFFLHRSPRFPGSGVGAIFGVAAALLMLVPLAYTIAKRIPVLSGRITSRVSMKTLLDLHVYAGLLGPLLAIVHTGHKFDSGLGIVLTAALLLVVVSGFAVRYLLPFVGQEMKDKLVLLQTARGDLDNAWGGLENSLNEMLPPKASIWKAGLASVGLSTEPGSPAREINRIAESVADLEYSVRMHQVLKLWFGRSLKLHIAVSVAFYVLLALHIGAAVQYGLRWFA